MIFNEYPNLDLFLLDDSVPLGQWLRVSPCGVWRPVATGPGSPRPEAGTLVPRLAGSWGSCVLTSAGATSQHTGNTANTVNIVNIVATHNTFNIVAT